MTYHTPGPYFIDDGMIDTKTQAELLLVDIGTEREWVAIGPGDEETPTQPAEVVALCHPDNAPLLAAAPELSDALFKLADSLSERSIHADGLDAQLKQVRALLARCGKELR